MTESIEQTNQLLMPPPSAVPPPHVPPASQYHQQDELGYYCEDCQPIMDYFIQLYSKTSNKYRRLKAKYDKIKPFKIKYEKLADTLQFEYDELKAEYDDLKEKHSCLEIKVNSSIQPPPPATLDLMLFECEPVSVNSSNSVLNDDKLVKLQSEINELQAKLTEYDDIVKINRELTNEINGHLATIDFQADKIKNLNKQMQEIAQRGTYLAFLLSLKSYLVLI